MAVKLFLISYRLIQKLFQLAESAISALKAVNTGIWLGLLSDEKCYELTKAWYTDQNSYHQDATNLLGFFENELKMVTKHFDGYQSVLVGGAGGGREILHLMRLGFDADGFECNESLCNYGNDFLQRQNVRSSIEFTNVNQCPCGDKIYDGILIGWGVYIHIMGRAARIIFLQQAQQRLQGNGKVILGYCHRSADSKTFKVVYAIAKPVRQLVHGEILELGDKLEPTLEHHFSLAEISGECNDAGLQVVDIDYDIEGRALIVLQRGSTG